MMKQRILVVEDDPTLNERMRSILSARWPTEGALTATDARARLEAEHFDLLVLDLLLPDRDGLDLLGELEREGLIGRAIVVTGHGDMSDAIEALRLHSLDFLTKPFDADELLQRVERVLAEEPPIVAPLETVLARVRTFLRTDKIAGAEAQLQAARQHFPESPEVLNLVGAVAELRHDLTSAVELYRRAERLGDRLYPPARRNAERLAFRSWKRDEGSAGIDLGDRER